MSEYQHILAAINIYGNHQPVLDKALALAGPNTKITLIYVIEPVYYTEIYDGGVLAELHNKAVDKAREAFDALCDKANIAPDRAIIEDGHPGSKIHAAAEAGDVDLIVLGSHGKRGLQLLLGSTANAVLHGAGCDVLAVRIYDDY